MTHADFINLWPTLADFAEDISVQYGTAKAMRRRSSIPPDCWVAAVDGARSRGIPGVDFEALARAVARPVSDDVEVAQ